MSMRIYKALLLLVATISVVACGGNEDENLKEAEIAAAQQADSDGKTDCALAGSSSFERTCTTERLAGPNGQLLLIRHADGGFRRFRILSDGRGLTPADGFDQTNIALIENGMIEVSSGDDKYRLPAQIRRSQAAVPKDGS